MHFAEGFVREVGVDLRRRDVGVAEEFLHGAEVGAVHEEVRREAVAEFVRVDALCDAGFLGTRGDHSLHGARRDGTDHVAALINAHEKFFFRVGTLV